MVRDSFIDIWDPMVKSVDSQCVQPLFYPLPPDLGEQIQNSSKDREVSLSCLD